MIRWDQVDGSDACRWICERMLFMHQQAETQTGRTEMIQRG